MANERKVEVTVEDDGSTTTKTYSDNVLISVQNTPAGRAPAPPIARNAEQSAPKPRVTRR